jgi:hypothetical protein
MTHKDELLDTIEEIRKKSFPELPADLVRDIVLIEQNFTDNRQEAYKQIGSAVDAYLKRTSNDREDK